ncbi:hypothetical protein R3P38DRAFT_2764058 [Favolaschia claudopus]|uniref:Uncharacterized protein n=1 Tax=Favolaschia claudopus TaxID=2862362 RepID=A0AAW0DGX1_9AGAR
MTVQKNIAGTKYVPNGLQTMVESLRNALTGLVDLVYGLERKPLELKRLNRATRVDYDRLKRSTSRHKGTGSIEYVSLIGLQNRTLQVSGVLARFRDIDFNGYRHCVNPNTPIESYNGIQEGNTRAGTLSTDVKVSDPTRPTEFTKIQNFFGSFGKEIEEHAIQQGSVRVNNGIQQDIGELAAHSSPLERKGNQGHRSQGKDVSKQQPTIIRPETTEPQYNTSNSTDIQ